MMESKASSTGGGGNPFGPGPQSESTPQVTTPAPIPPWVPDPDARSPLNGAECPWGMDQDERAKRVEDAGFKIEFNCDLVLYQEDVYGSVTPGWPTFDDVKRSYEQVLSSLTRDLDFLKETAEKRRFSRITFNIKTGGSEISFKDKTIFFSGYGAGDSNQALDYVRAVFEFQDTHLDGLPVISNKGRIKITGSRAQLEATLSILSTFTETYADYRDEFLAAGEAIREVDLGERPEDDAPLFRNGILTMAAKTRRGWALHDALSVAKSYLSLPEDFRNSVTIDIDQPGVRNPEEARPERVTAEAIELLAREVGMLRAGAPALQQLTLNACSLEDGGCGSVNSGRTGMTLGFFVKQSSGAPTLHPASSIEAQIARLLPLGL